MKSQLFGSSCYRGCNRVLFVYVVWPLSLSICIFCPSREQHCPASSSHRISPGLSTRKCTRSLPGNHQSCVSVREHFQVPQGGSWLWGSLLFRARVCNHQGCCVKETSFPPFHLATSSMLSSPLAFPSTEQSSLSLENNASVPPLNSDILRTLNTGPGLSYHLQKVYDKCLMNKSTNALVLLPAAHDKERKRK